MDKDEFDGVPDDFLDDIDDENLPLEMYDQKRYKENLPTLKRLRLDGSEDLSENQRARSFILRYRREHH